MNIRRRYQAKRRRLAQKAEHRKRSMAGMERREENRPPAYCIRPEDDPDGGHGTLW